PRGIYAAGLCRSRRADELRKQPEGWVSSGRSLYRPHPQGREAGGPAGGAGEQVRASHQRRDCQDARPHRAALAARPRRRGDRAKRREFIALLGGAATWPLAARAQQSQRMRRIGVLIGYAGTDVETQSRMGAFRQKLQELGWTEGRNIEIDFRVTGADP